MVSATAGGGPRLDEKRHLPRRRKRWSGPSRPIVRAPRSCAYSAIADGANDDEASLCSARLRSARAVAEFGKNLLSQGLSHVPVASQCSICSGGSVFCSNPMAFCIVSDDRRVGPFARDGGVVPTVPSRQANGRLIPHGAPWAAIDRLFSPRAVVCSLPTDVVG